MERGLSEARDLDTGSDGNAGHLLLGFDAAMSGFDSGHAFGTVDYLHHLTETPLGELSAFAHGFGGATMQGGTWTPELGITGGLGLRW